MLILTRNVGQKIMIGDDVTITVMTVSGQQVRIGIDAPQEVSIDREEVRQRKTDNPDYYTDKLADNKAEQRGNK